MSVPDTRPSLLLRIRQSQDAQAWREFEALYRPVVMRMAARSGFQPADAEDLAQQVLLSISRAIDRYDVSSGEAKFRTYLRTIARRAILNAITRGAPDRGCGGSEMLDLLHQQPDVDCPNQALEHQYRQEIFHSAAAIIRSEFRPETWAAFWESVVCEKPVDEVAAALGRSRGSVYTARSRVIRRLREKVGELDTLREDDSP